MSYSVVFYQRPNGERPVRQFLDSPGRSNPKGASIADTKIDALLRVPIRNLRKTSMVNDIVGTDPNFYELVCGDNRIAFYCDPVTEERTLLWPFKKQRRREPQHIEQARRVLHEFLESRKYRNR